MGIDRGGAAVACTLDAVHRHRVLWETMMKEVRVYHRKDWGKREDLRNLIKPLSQKHWERMFLRVIQNGYRFDLVTNRQLASYLRQFRNKYKIYECF